MRKLNSSKYNIKMYNLAISKITFSKLIEILQYLRFYSIDFEKTIEDEGVFISQLAKSFPSVMFYLFSPEKLCQYRYDYNGNLLISITGLDEQDDITKYIEFVQPMNGIDEEVINDACKNLNKIFNKQIVQHMISKFDALDITSMINNSIVDEIIANMSD